MAIGFDYGNARLRAMAARLFDERAYKELLAKDLDGLITSLAQTDYKEDVEAALVRFRGLRCVQETLRTNLARALKKAAGFYEGQPAQQVDLLLSRWDRRNLLAILRAQAAPAPLRREEEISALLVPAGRLDGTALTQLMQQPSLRATVDLLVGWHIPDAATARNLLQAWPAYEQSQNLAVLEQALNQAYAGWLDQWLHCRNGRGRLSFGLQNDLLSLVLCEEMDQINLMVALRLRQARQPRDQVFPIPGETRQQQRSPYLTGGSLDPRLLQRLAQAETREDVWAMLEPTIVGQPWRAALKGWVETGDLTALESELEQQLTGMAAGLFTRGDPLSIAVPIAYIWAKENEVRNLRILGQGLASQMDPALIRQELLIL